MAKLVSAQTKAELRSAWVSLGVHDPMAENMNALYKAMRGIVLVVHGPGATRLWRRPADIESLHTDTLCGFCDIAIVHGACEHQHVAHLHTQKVSRRVAKHPVRSSKQLPREPASPLPALLCGRPAAATPTPQRKPFAAATPYCDRRLARILEQCNLVHFKDAFRLEGVMLEDLAAVAARQDTQWLRTYFPDIPAGAAARLFQRVVDHHQDSPEDCLQAAGSRDSALAAPTHDSALAPPAEEAAEGAVVAIVGPGQQGGNNYIAYAMLT